MGVLFFIFFIGFLAVGYSCWLFFDLKKRGVPSEKIAEIAKDISLGVRTYLIRQLKTITVSASLLALLILIVFGWKTAICFIVGVFTSLISLFLGMNAVTLANAQTVSEAASSSKKAFRRAIIGGSVMGLSITGFSIIFLSILYLIFKEVGPLVGFGFGASLAALFAQIGGGIFTKAADIGADLVGKIEKGIPEDDPRNPAVIADLVGDNVGDCAGRGSDLFQTLSSDIITGMLLVLFFTEKYGKEIIFFPLILQSLGIFSSMVGIFLTRSFKKIRPVNSLILGLLITSLIAALSSFFLVRIFNLDLSIFLAIFLGIIITLVSSFSVNYYVGLYSQPVKRIAEASKRGAALNIITGLSFALQSPIFSMIIIMAAIALVFISSGEYLLALVGLCMGTDLAIGFIASADTFGPITDNAAGIAEMAGEKTEVIKSLSDLDSAGNTMKALTKSYALTSGTVTSFLIFATFFSLSGIKTIDVSQPFFVVFIFFGACLSFLISSLVIASTGKTAFLMVDEVRRQFREIKGLSEGKTKPDYKRCIDISTVNALKEMILPSLISILVPIFVGLIFGAKALGFLLIGSIVSAALLGPFFSNLGASFDNAKKKIEGEGLKGSFEHQAAVIADTVGDPLKDVAGPSLLIFMKLIGMTALLIINLIH
jgi:K(+)-stimulated pyrophosphate-energized sodium pump